MKRYMVRHPPRTCRVGTTTWSRLVQKSHQGLGGGYSLLPLRNQRSRTGNQPMNRQWVSGYLWEPRVSGIAGARKPRAGSRDSGAVSPYWCRGVVTTLPLSLSLWADRPIQHHETIIDMVDGRYDDGRVALPDHATLSRWPSLPQALMGNVAGDDLLVLKMLLGSVRGVHVPTFRPFTSQIIPQFSKSDERSTPPSTPP